MKRNEILIFKFIHDKKHFVFIKDSVLKGSFKGFFFFCLYFLLLGCRLENRSEFKEYKKALAFYDAGQYQKSLIYFKRVLKGSKNKEIALMAAKKAAEIAFYKLKDFRNAENFLHQMILLSSDREELIQAQEKIAAIYYEKLMDYRKAVVAFSRLIRFSKDRDKIFSYRMSLAKSYYYLKNFFQAGIELDLLMQFENLNGKQKFQARLFKAQVLLARKKIHQALKGFQSLEKDYPDLSRREKVGMNIVICYEELQKYDESIKKLTSMRLLYPDTSFIDLQLEKLRRRRSNRPGFKATQRSR